MSKLLIITLLLLSTSTFATTQTVDPLAYVVTSQSWQAHFWNYIFAHPELNPAQRSWLDASIAKLNNKDISSPLDRAQLRHDFIFARNEATVLFGPVVARELLTTLNPPSSMNLFAFEKAVCPCATESDWCNGSGYRCLSAGSNCTWQEMGCGTFMLESCNGLCLYCPGCN